MSELKRTALYEAHVKAGASMVDFGGWEMPMQYPTGIVEEHLFTRHLCSLFDVSHMGRFKIEGKDALAFLQHVVTSNVNALDLQQAQYCIISDENGYAIDDAYVYRFTEKGYLLVVNAANADKDLVHLNKEIKNFDATLTVITAETASIAVQGPKSKEFLTKLLGIAPTAPMKNALNVAELNGKGVAIAMTGYTGEPLGYEIFVEAKDAEYFWDELIKLGARPAGLGARDTLRTEATMPLYGHELGLDKDGKDIPVFAISLARFAVSFAETKGNFIGREALKKQFDASSRYLNRDFSDCAALPRKIRPITLLGKGVMRAGFPVYKDGKEVGYVTSGTMVPYYVSEGEGLETVITDEKALRPIGLALLDSDILFDDKVEVEIRGKLVNAVVPRCHMKNDAPPYSRIILHREEEEEVVCEKSDYLTKATELINKSMDNHIWRQEECINLIPSEMTPSPAVRLLSASDPSFRYAEHKKISAFYDRDIFYYQGTKFIDEVEQLLIEEMKKFLGCSEVETRLLSGQMSNMTVFSALMNFKNRLDRKSTPKRLGYVMNNHIINGGHLSAQPMGALKDFIAIDPATEKTAVVNFPVCKDNMFKIDVEATKKLIDEYRPELILFGKSMVLHKEPVAEIRKFVDENKIDTTIMYDMAHVLGLVGDHFQNPFAEGAEIVTGSTHKTFFGTQRGVIGCNYKEGDLKYNLWKNIESRAFPGSTSNHHLGTMLGQLMAAYEMNAFKDEYQKAVVENAKYFAECLHKEGLDVCGDPSISYTETHQVIVRVGYSEGPEVAERLERNNLIVNYQATPDEEGFTASGALRLGVNEMTRHGFGKKEFERLAGIMADCILRKKEVKEDVIAFRKDYTEMKYCFNDAETKKLLEAFTKSTGF